MIQEVDVGKCERWMMWMSAALAGTAAAESEGFSHAHKSALAKTAAHVADYAEQEYQGRLTDGYFKP